MSRPSSAALAVAALLALPAVAGAGRVEVAATGPNVTPTVTFRAAPGERNVLTVTAAPPDVLVRDTGAHPEAGPGCGAESGDTVRCPRTVASGFVIADVDLGDGDDRAEVSGYTCRVDAGPGNDTVSAPRCGLGAIVEGGGGRDELLGGPLGDTFSDGDMAAGLLDGDVFRGGEGLGDLVDYSDRTAPVQVDLAAGTGPEGDVLEAIEAIRVGSGADTVGGSERHDLLTGGAGDDALDGRAGGDVVSGEEGDDRIRGDDGPDSLTGGPGADRLEGGAGDDVLAPGRPGDGTDRLQCGAGDDHIIGYRFEDALSKDCEGLRGTGPFQVSVPARLVKRGTLVRVGVRTTKGPVMSVKARLTTLSGRTLASAPAALTRRGACRLSLRFPRFTRTRGPWRRSVLVVHSRVRLADGGFGPAHADRFHVRVGG